MTTLTYTPSDSSSRKLKVRVRKSQFGDGYAQRVEDGLNSSAQVWSLIYTDCNAADGNAIEAIFNGALTVAFDWTPPGGATSLKWVCEEGCSRVFHGVLSDITATIEQDFKP
jgi:phage-related protein